MKKNNQPHNMAFDERSFSIFDIVLHIKRITANINRRNFLPWKHITAEHRMFMIVYDGLR